MLSATQRIAPLRHSRVALSCVVLWTHKRYKRDIVGVGWGDVGAVGWLCSDKGNTENTDGQD